MTPGAASATTKDSGGAVLSAILLMLVIGPSNFVLYKLLFSALGGQSAFFGMQGVNFLYVVYGGAVLGVLRHRRSFAAMDALPRYPFAVMALLDCLGGLFAALGAASTPGQLQTLLNQSLVPTTMAASFFFLKTRYHSRKCLGALVILFGAVVVIAGDHQGVDPTTTNDERLAAVLTYWASNVPMALSSVYKESHFLDAEVDVMYLTQQVSIYQFFFGFLLMPFQTVPGVATSRGVSLQFVARDFLRQSLAFFTHPFSGTSLLLLCYVLANFVLNTTGLFVVKRGGAALSAIAYSILWPCSTLAFAFPFLGPYREPLRRSTLVGLALVFVGFGVYELDEFFLHAKKKKHSPPAAAAAKGAAVVPSEADPLRSPAGELRLLSEEEEEEEEVASFQERIVLVHVPILK